MAVDMMWSVVVLFLVTVGAAPVPDNQETIDTTEFLGEKACRLMNLTSGVTVEKTCGCENETSLGVTCDLGAGLLLSDVSGNQLEATFCRQEPVRSSDGVFTGVLASACQISNKNDPSVILKNNPCPTDVTCVTDVTKSISVVVDGTEAVASFCQIQLQEQEEEDDESVEAPDAGSDSSRSEDSGESQDQSQSQESEASVTMETPSEGSSAEKMCIRLSDD